MRRDARCLTTRVVVGIEHALAAGAGVTGVVGADFGIVAAGVERTVRHDARAATANLDGAAVRVGRAFRSQSPPVRVVPGTDILDRAGGKGIAVELRAEVREDEL